MQNETPKLKLLTQSILWLLAALAAFLIYQSFQIAAEGDTPQVYFLDVGQGDSELIKSGTFEILIDGGPDDKVLNELGRILPLSDRKIEEIILTHPHADHLTGLNLILDRYDVGEIYATGVVTDSALYQDFLHKVEAKKIPLLVPEIGETKVFFPESTLTFLWPGKEFLRVTSTDINNTSLITRFCLKECVLFLGDAQDKEQRAMLEYYTTQKKTDIFKAEILKVAHHGSKNGFDTDLYQSIAPKYAVIEVGRDNQFGHPRKEMLDLLNKISAIILRTDEKGTIDFKYVNSTFELAK